MILTTLAIFATLSLTVNFVMVWYIRKLLSMQEDMNTELYEGIMVFQEHIEAVLQTETYAGEPTLIKLLDEIRAFAESTEDIRIKLIPAAEDKKNIGEELNV